MRQVPLSRRVIFSDWHGVLSRDPFWTSIRRSATHALRGQLEAGMAGVFDPARDTASEWMKGLLSSDQVIDEMGIRLPRQFRDDFLARRLDEDCARMTVNAELFEVLRLIRAEAMVVVATDNMDCFARAFEHARSRRRRRSRDRETLADWAMICDDIICSSQAGALKSDDPQAFFGPWLTAHWVDFSDAVLIDDRADNCAAFASQGGTAIQWKMGTSDISELISRLRQWLDADPGSAATSAGHCASGQLARAGFGA
jgi:FMN phosphatase YigB (HAD superfamily)